MWSARLLWGKSRTILIVLCHSLLVLGLVSGCGARPELDTSLLTDDPCAAPCWHNITPGISDEDDVRSQLENSPFVKEGTLNYSLTEQMGVSLVMFSWRARGRDPNRVYLRDGKVLRIEIYLDYDLTLGEIVNKHGRPENMYAVAYGTEFLGYLVILDYPAQGLTISSFSYPVNYDDVVVEEGIGVLSEDLTVTRVVYYSPTSLEEALRDVFLYSPEAVEHTLNIAQEWEGFECVRLADHYYIRQ